ARRRGLPSGMVESVTSDTSGDADGVIERLDAYQQEHPWLAFPVAVMRKFGDDEAGDLAALIAYYGFLSLFPLLLVLVTLLGFFLHGRPDLQERILNSALAQFPIIGDQLRDNVKSLNGSGFALFVGLAFAIYGGLGVARAAQRALNRVWDVPVADRPTFFVAMGRSLLFLLVIGGGLIGTTVITGVSSAHGAGLRVLTFVASAVLNVVFFGLGFRVLTAKPVTWRDVLPGAILAG